MTRLFEVLPPEVALLLLLLCGTFGLAALLLSFDSGLKAAKLIVPHPSQPASMLLFVALPTSFYLIRIVMVFPLVVTPFDGINSPDSPHRLEVAPVDLEIGDWERPQPYIYPKDCPTAELTVGAVGRLGHESAWERIKAVREVAWWTGVCPGYAPFTLPRLVRALGDPDYRVRSAASAGLGSIGGHARPALSGLRGARGGEVAYFDHLLNDAILKIRRSGEWPAADICQGVGLEELERRAAELVDSGPEPPTDDRSAQ